MKKFWNFIRDDAGERVLLLEGPIDEDNLWGDAITPDDFKNELNAGDGDVTVWLNSPGGNVFAANQIYNALCEYKSKGKVTVKIDAIAASAASVIAMAGDEVLISPVGMLMIHDPMTMAMGNTKDMEQAIKTLNSVKESIITAYQMKTGLSHNKIAQLMSDETWLPSKQAKALGFVDGILYEKEDEKADGEEEKEEGVSIENTWLPYHARLMGQTIWAGLTGGAAEHPDVTGEEPEASAGNEKDVEPSEAGIIDKDPPKKPDEDTSDPSDGDNPSEDPVKEKTEKEDSEEGDTPESPDKEEADAPKKKLNNDIPARPVIGMDGKTEDGAMPYEILKRELLFLK